MINGKSVICISCSSNYVDVKGNAPRELILKANYAEAISLAGGIPIIAAEQNAADLAALCDGLLLSGGVDLQPSLYGEEPINTTVRCDPQRDSFEFALLSEFVKLKKPVFGICRGSQVINCFFEGSLYQDLPSQLGLEHGTGGIHPAYAMQGSVLFNLYGKDFNVNTYHHQAIKNPGNGLRITAYADNGKVAEASEHETLPIIATQFHPERLVGDHGKDAPDYLHLFKYFVDLAGEKAL